MIEKLTLYDTLFVSLLSSMFVLSRRLPFLGLAGYEEHRTRASMGICGFYPK